MRTLAVFVMGLLVGVAAQTTLAQNDAVVLNHVGVAVPSVLDAAKYYQEKLGFREAFRNTNPQGKTTSIYMQISKTTFLELQEVTAERPAGLTHFGLHVENMNAAVAKFRANGATVSNPNGPSAFSGAILAQLTTDAPMGMRIELAELGPQSLQRKAADAWK